MTAISTQNEVKDNEKVVDENKEDEIEVDPLEMFMKGIDETVKKEEITAVYLFLLRHGVEFRQGGGYGKGRRRL